MKAVIILVFWAVAFLVFWLCFFVAAPAVASLIPHSDWKGFLDFVIYALIAYFGGIALPLVIGFSGFIVAKGR